MGFEKNDNSFRVTSVDDDKYFLEFTSEPPGIDEPPVIAVLASDAEGNASISFVVGADDLRRALDVLPMGVDEDPALALVEEFGYAVRKRATLPLTGDEMRFAAVNKRLRKSLTALLTVMLDRDPTEDELVRVEAWTMAGEEQRPEGSPASIREFPRDSE